MSSEEELEKRLQKNALAIEELAIRIEAHNRQIDELLNTLNVSPEQLSTFIEKKEHFTAENWKALQELDQALEEKLKRELDNIHNPLKTKKTQAERNIQPHWLFVR